MYREGGGHHQGLREMQDRQCVVVAEMELLVRPGHRGLHSTLINGSNQFSAADRPASAKQCGAAGLAPHGSCSRAAADRRHHSMLVRSLRHRSQRWSPIHLETSERLPCASAALAHFGRRSV